MRFLGRERLTMKILGIFFSILALLILGMFASCDRNATPDMSHIHIKPVRIERYEADLFRIPADSLPAAMKKLSTKYPLFIGEEYHNATGLLQMENYLNDPLIIEAYFKSTKVFTDLLPIEKQLTEAFRHIKYYFPDWIPPSKVYTYISGYDIENGIFIKDSVLVIPLDNYLGSDFSGYKTVHIPIYITRRMNPENLIPDVVKVILSSQMADYPADGSLMEHMLAHGILLAAAEKILPETPRHLIIGFTPQEFNWCLNNEKEIWAFLLGHNLLFNKEKSIINKFVGEGPTTQGFPSGAPGRTGQFMGWQIAKSYLRKHPQESLSKWLTTTNHKSIFDQSGYKPPK